MMFESERIAQLERKIEPFLKSHSFAEIEGLPFSTHDQFRQLVEGNELSLGVEYRGDLINTLGTRRETVVHYAWAGLPFLCCAGFVVAALLTRNALLLLGVVTTMIGFVVTSPYTWGCTRTLLGVTWIPAVILVFTGPPSWAAIIGGLYFGYIPAATARTQFRMLVVRLALTSEILACSFLQARLLNIRDNATGRLL
jgi:hypothetical protein